jgi:hypothetical protein
MIDTHLQTLCKNYEGKFPGVPSDWKYYKQYATPLEFRQTIKTFWSFGVSKEIKFEEGIRKDNPDVKIYTWDPTPLALQTVARSSAGVTHTHRAYDPSEQVMQFYTTDPQRKCWSLENHDPANLVDTIEVETENLHTITQRLGTAVDLIKLDIEGRWYELCSEILNLELPVQMVHVEFEMYFGSAENEFRKLDEIVSQFQSKGFTVMTNRILNGEFGNIELCFFKK